METAARDNSNTIRAANTCFESPAIKLEKSAGRSVTQVDLTKEYDIVTEVLLWVKMCGTKCETRQEMLRVAELCVRFAGR